MKTLREFQQNNNFDSESIYPNYEILENILQTELDKHKNDPNFHEFDWQIAEKYASIE